MNTYTIETHFTFIGTFTVKAENRKEAIRIVEEDCGLVMGGNIHTSNEEAVKDWNFDTHPKQHLVSIS